MKMVGGDAELAFHQADPGNTSSITTLSNGDSILQERLARVNLASHQAFLQQTLLHKHKKEKTILTKTQKAWGGEFSRLPKMLPYEGG